MRRETVIRKRSRRQKRIRMAQRAFFMVFLMVVIVIALRTATDRLPDKSAIAHNVQAAALALSRPVEREDSQVTADLLQYAATDAVAAQIYEKRGSYPESLLAAYLNNPEMEGFVLGYLDADPAQAGELTSEEVEERFPLLLQWDKRWGYVPYGGSIIGLSGCGPTCLSMVLVSLTGDREKSPAWVAQFSEANGYYVEGSGTAWSLMTEGAGQLGLSARELPLDEASMKVALDNGSAIICSMGAGDFTTQGHFILIHGYTQEGFLVNDPNCILRSNKPWSFDKLQGQIKNLWAYTRG